MKKYLIVANWKMNLNVHEASILVKRLSDQIAVHRNIEVVLSPSLLTIVPVSQEIDRRKFSLCAQNAYFKDEGPYTGEVSFNMLRGLTEYVMIGHSERRIYFHENLEDIRDKVSAAVRNHIKPIICVGETAQEKAMGESHRVIHDQVVTAISDLTAEDIENIVIAYEPVWAISTFSNGAEATPEDVKPIVDLIRFNVGELYGKQAAEKLTILYGGSVNEHDVDTYLSIDGVEGALVGSASLHYDKFSSIVQKAYNLTHKD